LLFLGPERAAQCRTNTEHVEQIRCDFRDEQPLWLAAADQVRGAAAPRCHVHALQQLPEVEQLRK
jgi:hypothetical protein